MKINEGLMESMWGKRKMREKEERERERDLVEMKKKGREPLFNLVQRAPRRCDLASWAPIHLKAINQHRR